MAAVGASTALRPSPWDTILGEQKRLTGVVGPRRHNLGEVKMSTELVVMVEEAPEGGYTARALGASIFTEAEIGRAHV